MKNTPYDSYEAIFEALIAFGYSEQEAEQLICDVIEDQRYFDEVQKKVHKILNEELKKRIS